MGHFRISSLPIFAVFAALAIAASSAGPALAAGGPAVSHRAVRTGSSKWSLVPSPSPHEANELDGLSCVSASACIAVGFYQGHHESGTLAESWNGTKWSAVPSPNPSASGVLYTLQGVSCVSASDCTAVGGGAGPLVESWNGTKWSIVPSPNPVGSGSLNAVSCVSASDCTAVGAGPLVESWNGTKWSVVPSPSRDGNGDLKAVSCVSASACIAVGYYTVINSLGTTKTLAESWNGTTWSVVPSPNKGSAKTDNALYGVSCLSANTCTAVGHDAERTGNTTLVESWNGTTWSVVTTPHSAAQGGSLAGVSCVSASACTAVGSHPNSTPEERTLVESWNGTRWSVAPSPNKAFGYTPDYLDAVSCVLAKGCTAVGYYGFSASKTLVESNGAGRSARSPGG